jgi:hypothetical protein
VRIQSLGDRSVDLPEIIEYYLRDHAELDFDEIEIINNRPMNG